MTAAWMDPGVPEGWWPLLEKASVEKGALDQVDLALMHSLASKAGRLGDPAFLAVLACLVAAVRAGGLRIPIESGSLAARLEEYLGAMARGAAAGAPSGADPGSSPLADPADPRAFALRLAAAFTRARTDGAYAAVLGLQGDYLPLIHAFDGLYFQKHHAAEISVGLRLKALLTAPDLGASPADIGNILDTVLGRYPLRLSARDPGSASTAMEFDPRQRDALALALRKRFTVISGGPGTGKTSLAANLLRAWTRAWLAGGGSGSSSGEDAPRIRLAAPTGRAAQRLSESIRRSLESIQPPAPEGGADSRADRLIQGLACGTLHSLLRYNPGSGEYFHQAQRPLPADLILVDEVSMVDIFALARLLEALEPGACLVLLGDMDQLPSVEAGSVLADLVPHPAVRTTDVSGMGDAEGSRHPLADNLIVLDRSHRSEAGILDVTRRINAMDGAGALAAMKPPLVLEAGPGGSSWPIAFMEAGKRVCPDGGCRLVAAAEGKASAAGAAAGAEWLESWIAFHYRNHSLDPARYPDRVLAAPRRASYAGIVAELCDLPSVDDPRRDALLEEAFAYLDQARILTLTRKGRYGAVALNRRVRAHLIREWDPRAPVEGTGGFTGSPILILENDHAKEVYNGDVGIQLRIQGRDMIWFRRADAFQGFPAAFLPRHESAFAMTVHKSQGSEYDYALVVLPEPGNRLLFKETLYTALTRARVFAGIQGPAETFLEAVSRKVVRESGLPDYLRHLLS